MKHLIKRLAIAGVMPAAVISTLFSTSLKSTTGIVPRKIDRPYIVEVVDSFGNNAGEFKGVSSELEPFKISDNLGAKPFPEDKFHAFPDLNMGMGAKITLYRAPTYQIKDGKKTFSKRSWAETVGNLLTENKIELGDSDKINFSKDTELVPNMNINIIRVAITNVKESQSIDYNIIKKDDNTIDKGKTKVQIVGVKGTKVLTYEVHREDGEEVFRKLIKTEVTASSVDEILLIGTKPVITVRCNYNDTVIEASAKYGIDANTICNLMMKESNGHANSVAGGGYKGLFQYEDGFWADASKKAGFAGASIFDPKAQIFTTAWALTHGYGGRW